MKRYRIKLKFKEPIHLGYREGMFNITDTTIHSDTIFSGIVNCYSLLFGKAKTEKFIENILQGKLKVSSSFYYVDDEYLYPRPIYNKMYLEDFKKDKKIKYISEKVLKGQSKDKYVSGNVLLSKKIEKSIFKIEERPRVVVDRLNNGSSIYYTSCCRFNEGCGLWFYIDVEDELKDEVFASLKLLGDEGLGGMRSYGYGIFEFDLFEDKIEKVGEKNLLLSLCLPKKEDIERFSSYGIVERTGYIYSAYVKTKKHNIYRMFEEGSIVEGEVEGTIFDDTPDGFTEHKVYKYGRAFLVPFE
ncbi:MAG: type III-A CRISPR-associated RAMP protein Csm4 [Caloramator sp.]|nr:type III-A CRISPR-associated RAMP protein Csm4 [Caloramator sp.]